MRNFRSSVSSFHKSWADLCILIINHWNSLGHFKRALRSLKVFFMLQLLTIFYAPKLYIHILSYKNVRSSYLVLRTSIMFHPVRIKIVRMSYSPTSFNYQCKWVKAIVKLPILRFSDALKTTAEEISVFDVIFMRFVKVPSNASYFHFNGQNENIVGKRNWLSSVNKF